MVIKNNSHASHSGFSKVVLLKWCRAKPHKFGPYYRPFLLAVTIVSWESFIAQFQSRNSVGKTDVTVRVCLAEAHFYPGLLQSQYLCSFNIQQDRKLSLMWGLTSFPLQDSGLSWGLCSVTTSLETLIFQTTQALSNPSFSFLNSSFYQLKPSCYLLVCYLSPPSEWEFQESGRC